MALSSFSHRSVFRATQSLAAGLALLTACAGSLAAEWPDRPITMLMGFSAGSGVDVIARSIQEPLQQALGATVVIDYRAGAGGNLASAAVARAHPDGYTILLGTAATHGINPAIYKELPFDVEK